MTDGLTVEDVMEWLRRFDGRIGDIFGLWTQGKRDDRWVAEKLIEEGHIAAIGWSVDAPLSHLDMYEDEPSARRRAVAEYRSSLVRSRIGLDPLRGHDLACWCPLDQPCHVDVLLELANA